MAHCGDKLDKNTLVTKYDFKNLTFRMIQHTSSAVTVKQIYKYMFTNLNVK